MSAWQFSTNYAGQAHDDETGQSGYRAVTATHGSTRDPGLATVLFFSPLTGPRPRRPTGPRAADTRISR